MLVLPIIPTTLVEEVVKMQDVSTAVKALNSAAATFKELGWMGVVIFAVVLTFLLLKPIITRKAAEAKVPTVAVKVGANGNGGGGGDSQRLWPCPFHSGFAEQFKGLDKYERTNSEQHEKLFDGLKGVEVAVGRLTSTIEEQRRA